MEPVESVSGEEVFNQTKEKVSKNTGIWVGGDCHFNVINESNGVITGNLETGGLSEYFGLNAKEVLSLGKTLIKKKQYSLRSRIQQAGFNVWGVGEDKENLILKINNLTGKEITNVPKSLDLLRFFIDIPDKRLTGEELGEAVRNIYNDPNILKPQEAKDWTLKWHTYNVGVIEAPMVDLSGVIQAQDRKQLHDLLQIKWTDFDLVHPKFYLANAGQLHVPDDMYMRIVTNPETYYKGGGISLPHLNSPIVDPGFNGDLILEQERSNREADIADANHVLVFVYKI